MPCETCALQDGCQSPHMGGFGPADRPELMLVGEAPGYHEDVLGRPFVGDAGAVLDDALHEAGVDRKRCRVTNAVRCRPPGNKIADKMVRECKDLLLEEVAQVKPAVIVAMGNSPLLALTGKKGIMASRGTPQTWEANGHACVLMPTIHPAYVLRNPSALGLLVADLMVAKHIAETGEIPTPSKGDYVVVRDDATMDSLLHAVGMGATRLSWDIETNGLSPYVDGARVVSIQFSTEPGNGWLVPIHHNEAVELPLEMRIELCRFLLEAKSNPPLRGQNLKFDSQWVRHTLGIDPRPPVFDAFIAHHLLFEEASQAGGNGLKQMAHLHTDMGGYDQLFEATHPNFYERMAEIPLDELTDYACGDTDVLLRVEDSLRPLLEAENLLGVLETELLIQEFLTTLEEHGAAIDWDFHAHLMLAFPRQSERILSELRAFPEVREAETRYGNVRKTSSKDTGFNPNSPAQVRLLSFDVLALPPNPDFVTDSGEWSVCRQVVEIWLRSLPERAPARQIVSLIMEGKRTAKLFGGYVKGLETHKGADGRVHARFNQARTVTFRLSSSDPNLQQLPRDDAPTREGWVGKGDIKRMFVGGRRGWWVLEPDYSQIELRLAALLSQDAAMLDAFDRGWDLHALTASRVAHVGYEAFVEQLGSDDPKVKGRAKSLRSAAKGVNFGIIYGLTEESLAQSLADSDLAHELFETHRSTYVGFWRWNAEVRRELRRNGRLRSVCGHVRHLPGAQSSDVRTREEAMRQGGNFLVQNPAAKLAMLAGERIQKTLKADGAESYVFGEVHDSLWLTGPPDELDYVVALTRATMTRLPLPWLRGEDPRFPRTVPILVDMKVGENLADMHAV